MHAITDGGHRFPVIGILTVLYLVQLEAVSRRALFGKSRKSSKDEPMNVAGFGTALSTERFLVRRLRDYSALRTSPARFARGRRRRRRRSTSPDGEVVEPGSFAFGGSNRNIYAVDRNFVVPLQASDAPGIPASYAPNSARVRRSDRNETGDLQSFAVESRCGSTS